MRFHKGIVSRSIVCSMIAALVLSLLPLFAFSAQPAAAAEGAKIVGYYPSWGAYGRNYNVWEIDAGKVTHINYAFADICWDGRHGNPDPTGPNPQTWTCQDENGTINVPNGTIVLGDPWIDAQKSFPGDTWDQPLRGNLNQLIKLKQDNPHLKTIISVGGWTWSNRFSDVAASAQTRETFAKSAVDFVRKYQFDGVDLDWEYPVEGGLPGNSRRPGDKQNYTLLLQEVREHLDAAEREDGQEYLLTIASGASPAFAQNTELDKIAQVVDWINIMTYDFNGGWQTISAHNAPLYFDPAAEAAGVPQAASYHVAAAVQGHLSAGVPGNKLVAGLPFYGRGWGGCPSANNGEYQTCTGTSNTGTWEKGVYDFSDLEANYINKNGYTRYWNDTAKVPFLYNPAQQTMISYDDVESIGYKTAYIKSEGLAGAMFWEFSSDRNNTLLSKVYDDLLGSAPGDTTPPTAPENVTVTGQTANSVSLRWDAATDNVGVAGYIVSYDSADVDVSGTSTTITGLTPDTTYTFTVQAKDAAGNVSAASSPVTATTEPAGEDSEPPSAPANLRATETTSTSVTLAWDASTDNVGVSGYNVAYGTTSLDVTETSVTVSGLTADTSYTFTVRAKDAAGNLSQESSVTVRTNSAATCDYPAWSSSEVYTAGDRVTYNGIIYEAKWWTQGEQPDQSGEWGVWKYIGECS